MGARTRRWRRALQVTRVARRTGLLRVLAEIGVVGDKPATREGAVEFRRALEELGTTYIKLGQLLSSRPDLLPTSISRSSASSSTRSSRFRMSRSSR
jgi:ubiquinone biosynthesis protein